MKKIFAGLLVLTMLITAVSCAKPQAAETTVEPETVQAEATPSEPKGPNEYEAETPIVVNTPSPNELIKVIKDDKEVKLIMPKEFSEEMSILPEDMEKSEGIKSVVQNEDGSLTVTMDKADHEKMIADLKDSLKLSLEQLANNKELAYVTNITHDEEYRNITIKVKGDEYKPDMDFAPLTVGMMVSMYQAFDGQPVNTTIKVVDEATDKVLNELSLPMNR